MVTHLIATERHLSYGIIQY